MVHRMLLTGLLAFAVAVVAGAQEKKDEKKADEPRKGTVTGTVAAKGDNWIEIKADGEEKPRRYFIAYKKNVGPDKDMIAKIKETPEKTRVRIEWFFQERLRVETLEVLKASEKDK